MLPNPSVLSDSQVVVSVVAAALATVTASMMVLRTGMSRRAATLLLCTCCATALASWLRFGQLHTLGSPNEAHRGAHDEANRASSAPPGPAEAVGSARTEGERHWPFQFHEFFHYYIGAKYFSELGYLGLYDCTALADEQIARQDGVLPRLRGFVRDLGDVLADKTVERARHDCLVGERARFSDARWAAFSADVRQLQALVPDAWWDDVVNDKGLNPPPTWILLGSTVANAVPIRWGSFPACLIVTSLDAALVTGLFVIVRRAFGAAVASFAGVTFGTSFLANFGWLGGAVLRFTWVAAVVLAIVALRRRRWLSAGFFVGWAICDRLFPAAFAVGACLPLCWQARHDPRALGHAARFVVGAFAVIFVATAASLAAFGSGTWVVFAERLARDAHVHNVLHVGLDKILTYRSWTAHQDFHGHEGLSRFRAWNERVDHAYDAIRLSAIALQMASIAAVAWTAARCRPYEGAALFGVTAMFLFASPASYYYVILTMVAALLLRRAMTARASERPAMLLPLIAFEAFCIGTLLAPRPMPDAIMADFAICIAFAAFLLVWVAAWARHHG